MDLVGQGDLVLPLASDISQLLLLDLVEAPGISQVLGVPKICDLILVVVPVFRLDNTHFGAIELNLSGGLPFGLGSRILDAVHLLAIDSSGVLANLSV